MSKEPVVEVVLSRVKPGVADERVLEAADAIMQDVRAAGGFIRRELLKAGEGEWIDIIHWESREQAERAAQEIMAGPGSAPLREIVDGPSIRMYHGHPVRSYSA